MSVKIHKLIKFIKFAHGGMKFVFSLEKEVLWGD